MDGHGPGDSDIGARPEGTVACGTAPLGTEAGACESAGPPSQPPRDLSEGRALQSCGPAAGADARRVIRRPGPGSGRGSGIVWARSGVAARPGVPGQCRGQWRAAYVIKEGSEGSASQSKEGSVSYTYIHTYINIENTYIHTYRLQYVCMCVRTYVRTHDAMGAGGAWAGRDCRRKKGRRVLPTRMGRSDSLPDSSLYKYIYILYKYITYI